MMDVQAEQIDEGKDGFIYGAAPKPLPKPNKRLDAKIELFDYERWNSDWARNATDPASYAPEYESYIRQIEPTHGHDPGLIYARDFAQKVEKRRGKGGEFVQSLLARLSDRPDLQRAFLGGEVPTHPPQGTFRPGGEAGVKDWIDQDRIANGKPPKYSTSGIVQREDVPIVRGSYRPGRPLDPNIMMNHALPMNATGQDAAPDPKNLLEYVRNFGAPGDGAPPIQQVAAKSNTNPDRFAGFKEVGEHRRQAQAAARSGAAGDAASPGDRAPGPQFTEGIWNGTRHTTDADRYPPPPAPVPRPSGPPASVMGEQIHDPSGASSAQAAPPPPTQPDWSSMSDDDLARQIEERDKAQSVLSDRIDEARDDVKYYTRRRDGEDSTATGEAGKAIVSDLATDRIKDSLAGAGAARAVLAAGQAAASGASTGAAIPGSIRARIIGAGVAGASGVIGYFSGEAKRAKDVTTAERAVTALEALHGRDGEWLAAAKAEQERRRAAGR